MSIPFLIVVFLIYLIIVGAVIILVVLAIRALIKYIKSEPIRSEKQELATTLGECLKQERIRCGMTQEFVAEALGVSRQSVSKWENGSSDPSTTNLLTLAKIYTVSAEELLKRCSKA